MYCIPNELHIMITTWLPHDAKRCLSQVSSHYYDIVQNTVRPITSHADLKQICIKGDVYSIIRSKCHHYLPLIVKWAFLSTNSFSNDIADWLLSCGYDISPALKYFCRNLDLNRVLTYFPNRYPLIIEYFARYGIIIPTVSNINISNYIDILLKGAYRGSQHHIINKYQENVITSKKLFRMACRSGDITILDSVYIENDIEEGAINACKGGHLNVIKWLEEHRPIIWSRIIKLCAVYASKYPLLLEYLRHHIVDLTQNRIIPLGD